MVNTRLIKSRMIELDLSYEDMGKVIGKTAETARHKIFNYRPMMLDEAEAFQNKLQIKDDDFHLYFFASESRSATTA